MTDIAKSLRLEEKGNILVVTMFLLLMLTVIGMAAIHTSSIEMKISGNNKKIVEDFYISEGALITILEKSDWWLDEAFLNDGEDMASWSGRVDVDSDGVDDALVEIRCVASSDAMIEDLSQAANSVPVDRHVSPPPIDSGYSARHFNIRKFAVTASDLRAGNKVQAGVWKAFGKF